MHGDRNAADHDSATMSEDGGVRGQWAVPVEVLQHGSSAPPGAGMMPPQTLASVSGGPGTWGGPRLEWVNPLNLGAYPFILDDTTEQASGWALNGGSGA